MESVQCRVDHWRLQEIQDALVQLEFSWSLHSPPFSSITLLLCTYCLFYVIALNVLINTISTRSIL